MSIPVGKVKGKIPPDDWSRIERAKRRHAEPSSRPKRGKSSSASNSKSREKSVKRELSKKEKNRKRVEEARAIREKIHTDTVKRAGSLRQADLIPDKVANGQIRLVI